MKPLRVFERNAPNHKDEEALITLHGGVSLRLNGPAYGIFGQPVEYAELMMSEDGTVFGIRPSTAESRNAYKVSVHIKDREKSTNSKSRVINATKFVRLIRELNHLEPDGTYTYTPTLAEGLLVVDVTKPIHFTKRDYGGPGNSSKGHGMQPPLALAADDAAGD